MTSDAQESSAGTPTSACLTPLGREMCKTSKLKDLAYNMVAGGTVGMFVFFGCTLLLMRFRFQFQLGWHRFRIRDIDSQSLWTGVFILVLLIGYIWGIKNYRFVRAKIDHFNNSMNTKPVPKDLRFQHHSQVFCLGCAGVMLALSIFTLVASVIMKDGSQLDSAWGFPSGTLVGMGLGIKRGNTYCCDRCNYPWHDGEALRCPECQLLRVPPFGLCVGERRRSIPLIAAGVLVFFAGFVLYMPELFV